MLAGLLGSSDPPSPSGAPPEPKMKSCEILLRKGPSDCELAVCATPVEEQSSTRLLESAIRATTQFRMRDSGKIGLVSSCARTRRPYGVKTPAASARAGRHKISMLT